MTDPLPRPNVFSATGSAGWSRIIQINAGRLLLLLGIGVLWEVAARSEILPAAFIGQPSMFLTMLGSMIMDGSIFPPIVDTLSATLLAFCIGGVLALASALALTVLPTLREIVQPFIDALNALPRVALVPLFIVWFGLGMTAKVVSGVSLMYFILLYNTLAGARSVDPDHRALARSLGLSGREIFTQIVIPTAIPAIFAGLKLGLVYTLLGVVTAELIAGGKGLGSLVSYYSNTYNANGVFAVLVVLIILSFALSSLMTWIENRLMKWKPG
jgi:NitT/TauT family transport system permease protein